MKNDTLPSKSDRAETDTEKILRARIEESVEKILSLKSEKGMLAKNDNDGGEVKK